MNGFRLWVAAMAGAVAFGLAVVRSAAGRRARQGRQGRLAARYDRVGGISMHARVSVGSVPEHRLPVILIHGLGMSSRYIIPLAEHLAPHLRVYAPDLPGFGLSDKPPGALTVRQLVDALAAWMQALGLERAALVGNSLGCEVLVELALVHPHLVDRLVLQGPTPDPEARGIARQIAGFFLIAPFEHWSLAWVALTDYARSGIRRYLQTLRSMVDNHIGKKASRVSQPALVVWGTRDYIVPYAFVTNLAASLPQGRLAVIPGAAHGINYSHPEAFTAASLPFLLLRETSRTHDDRSEHSDGRGAGRRAGPQGPRS